MRHPSITEPKATQLVVCIDNDGYPASLEKRKIYVVLTTVSDRHGMVRIVDESGEDYLYPEALFRPIILPESIEKVVLAAA